MAVTVIVSNFQQIDDCEAYGNWTGVGAANVTDFFKEGTQCVGFELRLTGDTDIEVSGTWDLTGEHLRCWMMTTVLNEINTDANGGIQFYLSDGANTGYWYVSGSTTYPGGWYNLVVDLSRAVDDGIKPTMSAITTVGLRFNLTDSAKKVQSLWIDNVYVGDGLICYGDDGGGYFDLDDVLAEDENTTNGWGLIRKIGGVFFLVGSLLNGDAAGSSASKFQPKSAIVIFEDRLVNASLYSMNAVDNGTGTTEHLLGEDGGEGLVISVASLTQTPKFDLDFSDTDLTDVMLEGCKFVDAGTITLPLTGANKEVINCTFESCGDLIVSTCKVEDSIIINANSIGCRISSESHAFSKCTIKGSDYGIEFDTAGTYALSNVLFDTIGIAHIHNTSGGEVIINASGTTNCTTYTGNTTINNTKELTFTGLIAGTEVRAYTGIDPDTAVEIGGTESSSTEYLLSHESGGVAGYVIFHKENYEAITLYLDYPSIDGEIPIQQRFDRNYENP